MGKIRFKTLLIGVLVFSMLFGTMSVYADAPSSWAATEVTEAGDFGLIVEGADQNYQMNITRELFCELIVNMVEITQGEPVIITIENPFIDTNNQDIIKAYQLGIVNGTSPNTFAPEDLITREQVAAMMMRAARKLDTLMTHTYTVIADPETVFADLADISGWALSDVRYANALGIMNGVGGNRIAPQDNTTIEQSILLTLRVFNEYYPLMSDNTPDSENNPPEATPGASFTYNIAEGGDMVINFNPLVEDADEDTLVSVAFQDQGLDKWEPQVQGSLKFDVTAPEDAAGNTAKGQVIISDGTDETTFEVTFNIVEATEVNHAPEAIDGISFTMDITEGTSRDIDLTEYISDPDGDDMTVTANQDQGLDYWGSIPQGSMNYKVTVADNTAGNTARGQVTVSDGTDEATFEFSFRIIEAVSANNPPEATPGASFTYDISEGGDMIIDFNDLVEDADDDALTSVAFQDQGLDTWEPQVQGSLRFDVSAPEGSAGNTARGQVTISDGTDETTFEVTFNIVAAADPNTPPEQSVTTLYQDERTEVPYKASDFATDADGDTLEITAVENHPDDWGHPVGEYHFFSIAGRGVVFTFDAAEVETTALRRLLITVSDGTVEVEMDVRIQVTNTN